MNIYQEGFRTDISGTIFKLTGKTWLKITGIYALTSIAGYLIIFLLGLLFFKNIVSNLLFSNQNTQAEIMNLYQSLITNISSLIVIGFVFFILLFVLIGAWVTNFSLLLSNKQIKEWNPSFVDVLKQSFDSKVFSLFGVLNMLHS